MVLYVHGKCPESRALILCLVYTRQSKGISCASSNHSPSDTVIGVPPQHRLNRQPHESCFNSRMSDTLAIEIIDKANKTI